MKTLKGPLQKSKTLTFSSLYKVKKETKEKDSTMKADRNILQQLITAYQAGRKVDLHAIFITCDDAGSSLPCMYEWHSVNW